MIVVDWGHKHLGFAQLSHSDTAPGVGSHVICTLLATEHAQLAVGHPKYERHNEAHLQVSV